MRFINDSLRMPLERIRFRLGPDLQVEGLALGDPPRDVSSAWAFGQCVLAERWLCSGVVART